MPNATEDRSDRVKLVYNAQIDSPAGIVLDYLLNHPHCTSRQGRQQAIDAISAFYRPMAEEHRGTMQPAEAQEVARTCVEVLTKQIEALCSRYQIENPLAAQSGVGSPESLGRLERVLSNGLQAIAQALQTGSGIPATATSLEALQPAIVQPTVSFEQGVTMDGDELGKLGLLLDDDASFSDLAA